MTHHMIDVDTIHGANEKNWLGGQQYHFHHHGATEGPMACHERLEGLLFYYLLTGYKPAEEIALARAESVCKTVYATNGLRSKGLCREQAYPIIALSRMYDCYRDERYVRAVEKILDWLDEWHNEDGGKESLIAQRPTVNLSPVFMGGGKNVNVQEIAVANCRVSGVGPGLRTSECGGARSLLAAWNRDVLRGAFRRDDGGGCGAV